MTHRDDEEFLATDLSALDPHRDPLLTDRVIARAMTRIVASERPTAPSTNSVLGDVAKWWRPGLAAAALVTAVAGGSIQVISGRPVDGSDAERVETQLLDWTRTGHVPSNGELLAVFRGRVR